MPDIPDKRLLPSIEAALASSGLLVRIPAELRAEFAASQLAERRALNRLYLILFAILFAGFWGLQFQSAPEIVLPSGLLRFGLYCPCTMLFLALDRSDRLGRFYDTALVALFVLAGLISAVLCVLTTATTAMSDTRATVLILLATGLVFRTTLPAVIVNAVVSAAIYIGSVILSPVVPSAELGALIFTEAAIATGVIMFNFQLETRNRRLFLLNKSEMIYRAELAWHNRNLLKQTQTDALTGVANRRCFDDTLTLAWQTCLATGSPLGLVMVDIDHFKKYNDCYGHQGGDECLTRTAAQIRAQLRAGDLVARYGGEEFAIIMPGATIERAGVVAERVRCAVADMALPHAGVGPTATLTISLGVACLMPADPAGSALLIEMADAALYAAKDGGRNRVIVSPGGAAESAARAA